MRYAALLLALLRLFLSGGAQPTDAELTSFSYSHTASYVEGIYSYELCCGPSGCEASYDLYCGRLRYSIPVEAADVQALREIIDRNAIREWHGFDKSSSILLDGDGFSLCASFADGTEISARGYGSFPEGYSAAAEEIDALFMGMLRESGAGPRDEI